MALHMKAYRSALLAASAMVGLSAGLTGACPTAAAEDKPTFIMVSGPLLDPFFSAVKLGADAAAKDYDVNYQFVAVTKFDNLLADYTHFMEQAISRHPAALIVADFFPGAMDPLIKEAVKAGIPVVVHNSGQATWKENGALTFIGEDPLLMGGEAGRIAVAAGAHHGVCVNQYPENPVLARRCDGYAEVLKAAGGTSKVLALQAADSQNPTAVVQAIKGVLKSDPTIDAIFTLGAPQAQDAVQAAAQTEGRKFVIGSTDLSNANLESVKNGELTFLIDQQPYLQGYDTIQIAAQYMKYGMHPVGGVLTGPNVITKDNVDSVLKVNKAFPGVRGAS
jgi:simple sugar transport system substrate-binding protein